MKSRRAIHRGSSIGIDVPVVEDVSDLDRKSLEEMMMTLPDVAWVLKIVGSVSIKNSDTDVVEQFFGGDCIGSEGLILTTSQGMTPELEKEVQGVTFYHNLVSGRPRNNPSFNNPSFTI
ncbi:hypothetical protein A2U01_0049966 [Trifolium medium]|uniref:Uncharacterized protein n=1 Tax=Trifolium medium TaxID=97028 RepID=A0A392QY25_9FABA|nr:hypothetical protein [Trifolium medium]